MYQLFITREMYEQFCKPFIVLFDELLNISALRGVGRSRDRFPVVLLGIFFFRGTPDRTMCPEVDSASESEYQGFLVG